MIFSSAFAQVRAAKHLVGMHHPIIGMHVRQGDAVRHASDQSELCAHRVQMLCCKPYTNLFASGLDKLL